MIKFIRTKIRKNFLFLFNILKSIIFLYLILNIQILQAKVIGYVEEIKGNAIYKENDQTIELDLLDEIATGVKFFTQNDSTLSVSLDDGTILIIYENSEFLISSFNNIDTVSPGFEIIFSKGSFIIETGEIPKLTTDKAIIKSPSGDLYLNGTALSGDFSSSSNSQVFLFTDSFGKKGEVKIATSKGEVVNVEPDRGLSINENAIETIELNENTQSQVEFLKEVIVESAIPNEEKINKAIENKISKGKVADLDGDGVIGESDFKILKEEITSKKENKLNQIITSTGDDASLISKVVEKSSDDLSNSIIDKVIADKPEITSNIVNELIEKNPNKFDEIIKSNDQVLDKIIDTVVDKADANDKSIGKLIANADENLSQKLMDDISIKKSDLMLNIISEASAKNPEKINSILSQNEELSDKVTEKIADTINNDIDSVNTLKNFIVNVDPTISSKVLDTVSKENNQIAKDAVKIAIEEDKEMIQEKLSRSINVENSTFSKVVIAEVISSGEIEVIDNAISINENAQIDNEIIDEENEIIENAQIDNEIIDEENEIIDEENDIIEKKQNILNNISNAIDEASNELEEDGSNIKEIAKENIKKNLSEKLVSPN